MHAATTMMRLPEPDEVLHGARVRLDPLDDVGLHELAPKLWHPEVFAGGHGGGPATFERNRGFVEWFPTYRPSGEDARTYLVRCDGEAVGTTSLYRANLASGSVLIGYTSYTPTVWGSVVNPDTKRTLLEAAFSRGAHRVGFEVDDMNARSQAAVAKLGAHLDGVLREDRLRADGSWRSTHVYSILAAEWPEVRARLDARIAALAA